MRMLLVSVRSARMFCNQNSSQYGYRLLRPTSLRPPSPPFIVRLSLSFLSYRGLFRKDVCCIFFRKKSVFCQYFNGLFFCHVQRFKLSYNAALWEVVGNRVAFTAS